MDKISHQQRSKNMAAVRGKNTIPELIVRHVLHAMGHRFRLHRKDLPGKPDIVLPKYRTCIFVHGCFWHQHPGCKRASNPSTNMDFWSQKLDRNVERDKQNGLELHSLNWRVFVIWECETKDIVLLEQKLRRFLKGTHS
ncbi:MAG: DNA mismatch endonuclease Vsr [Proteobacteria bacterium]|nr:DNA mismatch endonuclease Vsr [Pseudomonadota bacterium]